MDLSLFSQHTQFALSLMDEVSAFIASHFDGDYEQELKADRTVVTEIDRQAEQMIRSAIKKEYPFHGILGEEFGEEHLDSEFAWIIDPIDGTKNFSNDIPLYGSILALHYKGDPIIGVIDHPSLKRRIWAEKGKGCYYLDQTTPNGIQKLEIGPANTDPFKEMISLTSRNCFLPTQQESQFDELFKTFRNIRMLTDCFGHTLAAKGSFGAAIDYNISLWDVCATKIIVEEAGGEYYEEIHQRDGKNVYNIICGKPEVVNVLIKHFKT